ncbi:MAG: flavodoxin family protein [Chloroflexi bacterium]|nr:flavodoxin family protein [Chloroflexota bacterium]
MNILYISGSPRTDSNTDILLNTTLSITGGQFLKLSNFNIKPCVSCKKCLTKNSCVLLDDMTNQIIPLLLNCDGIVLGSPVYFNNVSSQLKAFMDRTWCLKDKLRNKIGAAIVVGRGYGIEGAITAINAFFLKHEIIVANRGVSGIAFESGEITQNQKTIEAAKQLGSRIIEMVNLFNYFINREFNET